MIMASPVRYDALIRGRFFCLAATVRYALSILLQHCAASTSASMPTPSSEQVSAVSAQLVTATRKGAPEAKQQREHH